MKNDRRFCSPSEPVYDGKSSVSSDLSFAAVGFTSSTGMLTAAIDARGVESGDGDRDRLGTGD